MYIALENIRSLYNIGAIFRTGSFLGVKNILLVGYSGKRPLPDGTWELNKKIEKTSLGTINDLKIKLLKNSDELIEFAKNNKLKLVVVEQDKKSVSLDKWRPKKNSVLVFGNEIKGVSKKIMAKANEIIEIPKKGKKTSLNVATTAGIVIYKASLLI